MQHPKFMALAAMVATLAACRAQAGSIQEPGETAGVALGPPLPPGAYFINFLNYGVHDSDPRLTTVVEIPVLAWSTPWTFLGGRVLLGAATPAVDVGVQAAPGSAIGTIRKSSTGLAGS